MMNVHATTFLSRTLLAAALWVCMAVADNVTFTNKTLPNVCDSQTQVDPKFGPPFNSTGTASFGLPINLGPNLTVFELTVGFHDTRDNATNKGVQRLSSHVGMPIRSFNVLYGSLKLCLYHMDPFRATLPDTGPAFCSNAFEQDCEDYINEFERSFNLTASGDCPEFDIRKSKCGGQVKVASGKRQTPMAMPSPQTHPRLTARLVQ